MNTQNTQQNELTDIKVSLQMKLASLWASFMFLYIYVDYFHLYMTDTLKDMITGKVFVFQITQGFLLAAIISITIPTLMIFLSVALVPVPFAVV